MKRPMSLMNGWPCLELVFEVDDDGKGDLRDGRVDRYPSVKTASRLSDDRCSACLMYMPVDVQSAVLQIAAAEALCKLWAPRAYATLCDVAGAQWWCVRYEDVC